MVCHFFFSLSTHSKFLSTSTYVYNSGDGLIVFGTQPFWESDSPHEIQVIHIRTDKKTDFFFFTLHTAALDRAESLSCTKEENTQTAISKALKSTFSIKNRNSRGCFILALDFLIIEQTFLFFS